MLVGDDGVCFVVSVAVVNGVAAAVVVVVVVVVVVLLLSFFIFLLWPVRHAWRQIGGRPLESKVQMSGVS